MDEFGQWDVQDRKLEGLSKLRSRCLASVPREDSGVVGWRGTEGGGGLPGCRERKVGPRVFLAERPKGLGWGQGGVGWSWRRGRRFVGVGL